MYNIYFRNRVLTICEKDNPIVKDNSTILLHPSTKYKLSDVPYMMDSNINFKHLVITELGDLNQEELYKKVTSKVNIITAAGGLIKNSEGKYLMIYRRGIWDLPKGKQEENEEVKVTATREVEEEVGLKCVPEKLICITHHSYRIGKKLAIKDTYWYLMHYDGTDAPVPQTEELIERCEWCTPEDIMFNLQDSFASVREVFEVAGIISGR